MPASWYINLTQISPWESPEEFSDNKESFHFGDHILAKETPKKDMGDKKILNSKNQRGRINRNQCHFKTEDSSEEIFRKRRRNRQKKRIIGNRNRNRSKKEKRFRSEDNHQKFGRRNNNSEDSKQNYSRKSMNEIEININKINEDKSEF